MVPAQTPFLTYTVTPTNTGPLRGGGSLIDGDTPLRVSYNPVTHRARSTPVRYTLTHIILTREGGDGHMTLKKLHTTRGLGGKHPSVTSRAWGYP